MLAECLSEQGEWTQVMPGARACLFSLREKTFPLPLRLESLHFEVLFCLAGPGGMGRFYGSVPGRCFSSPTFLICPMPEWRPA